MSESVNIQVGGNVAGSIVVGDANFVVNTNYGSIVYQQARPQARLREFAPQAPRPARGFINRTVELAKLSDWISNNEIVLIHAPDGVGKSALLRQAANLPAAKKMQHGVIFLEDPEVQGNTWSADDIIQKLFDALFESDPPLKVDAISARTYLSNTHPLVLLDEIPLAPGLQRILPDLFPQGAILMAADIPIGTDFQRMALGPLPRTEAVALLVKQSGVSPNEDQQIIFDNLCSQLKDISLALIITGNIIRETSLDPQEALDILKSLPAGANDPLEAVLDRVYRLAFGRLNSDEQKLLSIAAQTPGSSIAPEWLSAALGTNADLALERLKAIGLLFANSPRLRMPPGFRGAARRSSLLDEDSVLGKLVDYLLTGATQGTEFVQAETGNLFGALMWAARVGRPRDVIALGRSLDAQISLQGLWDRWGQVLQLTLEAAQQTRDSLVQGWALHQLGTREIGIGTRERAIEYLGQALRLRRVSGDFVGMAYTQHNIDFLFGPPSPPEHKEPEPRPTEPQTPPAARPANSFSRTLLITGALAITGIAMLAVLAGVGSLLLRPTATEAPFVPPPAATTHAAPPTSTQTTTSTLSPTVTLTNSMTPSPSVTWTPSNTPTPTAPGGSGQIIFENTAGSVFSRLGSTSLYALDLGESTIKDVNIDLLSTIRDPAWSYDGRLLAFSAHNDSDYSDIFIAKAGSSRWSQITNDFGERLFGNKSHPAWSPDGKQIAFLFQDPNQRTDIYAVNADGSSGIPTNLTNNTEGISVDYPEWSPDGRRIAYQAFVNNNWEIFVMNADGSNQRQLTFADNPEQWSVQASWSPDGKQLVFASNRGGSWDIYIMNQRGGDVRELTKDDWYDVMPDWSPDGQWIAFTSNRTKFLEIYMMPVSGFEVSQLSKQEAEALSADWRPK